MPWDYGSQHQVRRWILERPEDVNADLLKRNDALRGWASKIEWLSPRPDTNVELRDQAWTEIGLAAASPQEAGWWPRGGAVWDAVARVNGAIAALRRDGTLARLARAWLGRDPAALRVLR